MTLIGTTMLTELYRKPKTFSLSLNLIWFSEGLVWKESFPIRTCNSPYSEKLNWWPDRPWPEGKNRENILLLVVKCYCYTACPDAPILLVVFSNLCWVSQTSWMETICLTNEPIELVQQMAFMLSSSGISLWTDHLFLSHAPSTEGSFMISVHKGSLCVPISLCGFFSCLWLNGGSSLSLSQVSSQIQII